MFLEKYKELDNLCKDILHSNKGVSSYIESMEECGLRARGIEGWEKDYRNLKEYRCKRNQIVHENNITEEDLCSTYDEIWLEQFYERILKRDDPLARYRDMTISVQQRKVQKKQNIPTVEANRTQLRNVNNNQSEIVFALIVSVVIISIIIGLLIVLL